MFKTILATASATLIAVAIAQPAHAGGGWTPNGTSLNGTSLNGTSINGGGSNGQKSNGRNFQGTSAGTSSFAIDGIELPAAMR